MTTLMRFLWRLEGRMIRLLKWLLRPRKNKIRFCCAELEKHINEKKFLIQYEVVKTDMGVVISAPTIISEKDRVYLDQCGYCSAQLVVELKAGKIETKIRKILKNILKWLQNR